MSAYFEIWRWIWIVGNWILFKVSLGWKISDKVWRSYAWSKFGWLFLRNPNLATFGFWWIWGIPWGIMIKPWSNDGHLFKMFILTKNLKFDCMWATIDFWPNTVDSQASEQLTEQTSCARHENWHGWSWGHIRAMENIWDPWSSHILMKTEILVRGLLPYEENLSGQFLVILGQVGDLNGHVLSKMREKISGYNNCPCSIFLNLRM